MDAGPRKRRNAVKKNSGLEAEKEFLQMLKSAGFWAHKLKENKNGAPFDIIAAINGFAFAFEVKNIARGTNFPLARVEDNQINGFRVWDRANNLRGYFAFRTTLKGWRCWESWDICYRCKSQHLYGSSIDVSATPGGVPWERLLERYGLKS